VHVQDCTDCEKPEAMVHRIEKTIELIGALDEEQRKRLREIADHCPVHKTLTSKIVIETTPAPAA
jgi:putative redox protein